MFDDREDHASMPLDDAWTAKTVDDERLIGAGLAEHLRHEPEDDQGTNDDESDDDEGDKKVRHNCPLSACCQWLLSG